MAPASAIPPQLPPSVEEAYRRKCIKLKERTKEVEEANDASRLRLARLKRQVEKMRIERAFLLEQLARRTSTNVEDSDGSPSPPPTPKEKPMRLKRGHRKPSLLADVDTPPAAGSGAAGTTTSANAGPKAQSPSSDAPSQNIGAKDGAVTAPRPGSAAGAGGGGGGSSTSSQRANGLPRGGGSGPPRKPGNAFELYCADARPALAARSSSRQDGEAAVNVEEELARGWKDLPDAEREAFQERQERELAAYQKEKEAYTLKMKEAAEATEAGEPKEDKDAPARDEDVEMANYDTDQEMQEEKPDE